MADILAGIRRLLKPIEDRISSGIARGVVKLIDNDRLLQELQITILPGEVRSRVEHFQPYGFEAVPFPESEHLVVFLGNRRDSPAVVSVVDRRHRPTDGLPGMAGLYDDLGQRVRLYRDRVEIESGTKIVLNAPLVEVSGDLTVAGNITSSGGEVQDSTGKTLDGLRVAYDSHVHLAGVPPGTTGGTSAPS